MSNQQILILIVMFAFGVLIAIAAADQVEYGSKKVAWVLRAASALFAGPPIVYLWIAGVFG